MHHFNRIRFCRVIEELAVSLKPSERKIITSSPEGRSILGIKSHLAEEFRRISLSRIRRSKAELFIRAFFFLSQKTHESAIIIPDYAPGGGSPMVDADEGEIA